MQYLKTDLEQRAEGPRYALLRRLAPAIRHQMAGGFQPVTMMTAIIEKRLKAVTPDLPALAKTSNDVRQLAIAATRTSLDLIGWLAPDPEAHVALSKGVEEGLHLVATELSFRGFKCINQTEGVAVDVALIHMRGVFVAALLAVTDAAPMPTTVLVTAQPDGMDVVVTLTLSNINTAAGATETASSTAPDEDFHLSLATYRKIDWTDVEAMAAADGVALQHASANVVLRLPIAQA